jgi:hypothetical protein
MFSTTSADKFVSNIHDDFFSVSEHKYKRYLNTIVALLKDCFFFNETPEVVTNQSKPLTLNPKQT